MEEASTIIHSYSAMCDFVAEDLFLTPRVKTIYIRDDTGAPIAPECLVSSVQHERQLQRNLELPLSLDYDKNSQSATVRFFNSDSQDYATQYNNYTNLQSTLEKKN